MVTESPPQRNSDCVERMPSKVALLNMNRRRILWLTFLMAAVFAIILIYQSLFRQHRPAQIRVGHDSSDIVSIADRGVEGGYDSYFSRANLIRVVIPSGTNAMARH
jgi:hypothetical protein